VHVIATKVDRAFVHVAMVMWLWTFENHVRGAVWASTCTKLVLNHFVNAVYRRFDCLTQRLGLSLDFLNGFLRRFK